AAEAEARLFAAIDAEPAPSEPALAPPVPADLQTALEALGYVSQDEASTARDARGEADPPDSKRD
ncbi:MAG: hypothetical protein ACR2PQ_09090, partial [Myxococcota bacterium]